MNIRHQQTKLHHDHHYTHLKSCIDMLAHTLATPIHNSSIPSVSPAPQLLSAPAQNPLSRQTPHPSPHWLSHHPSEILLPSFFHSVIRSTHLDSPPSCCKIQIGCQNPVLISIISRLDYPISKFYNALLILDTAILLRYNIVEFSHYLSHALNSFSALRLFLGSSSPICLKKSSRCLIDVVADIVPYSDSSIYHLL